MRDEDYFNALKCIVLHFTSKAMYFSASKWSERTGYPFYNFTLTPQYKLRPSAGMIPGPG